MGKTQGREATKKLAMRKANTTSRTTTNPTKRKAHAGQPTLYRPDLCALVLALGAKGKSYTGIATRLGVSRDSIYEWAKVHVEFSDALTRARELAQAWWEDVGQESLTTPSFQSSMWAKNMSCRFPDDWRDVTRNETTGKNGGPLELIMAQIVANPKSRIVIGAPFDHPLGSAPYPGQEGHK